MWKLEKTKQKLEWFKDLTRCFRMESVKVSLRAKFRLRFTFCTKSIPCVIGKLSKVLNL